MQIRDAESRSGRKALWFGLLGGAAAWTVHLLSAYAIAEFGCVGGLAERSYLGITHVAWLELMLTVAMTAVAAAAAAVAFVQYRRLQSGHARDDTRRDDRHAAEYLTARAGLLTSSIFTFVILVQSIPIFFYLPCC